MKKLLLILDVEEAFMNSYTEGLPNEIEDYVSHAYYDDIVVGKFLNEEDSIFVKRLGETRCLHDNETKLSIQLSKPYIVMERTAYTMYTEELESYLKENNIKYIYLCGLDTDRSIYKTALDLFERGYFVYVIKDLCKSSGGDEFHQNGISLLERNIGKDYVI